MPVAADALPRSLKRSINGDRPLGRRGQLLYVAQGVWDLLASAAEGERAAALRLTREEIAYICGLRGGNTRVSSQRLYFRHVCVLLRRLSEGRRLEVLDLGCGAGAYSDVFKKCVPGSVYVGIDARASDNWERERAKTDGLERRFEALDLCGRPLPWEGRFDLCVSWSALEHFPDVGVAVAQAFRASKPGARHLHAVPTHWSLFTYWWHGFRRFSASSLRRLFEEAGFAEVSVVSLGGLATFLLDKALLLNPVLLKAQRLGFAGPLTLAARLHGRLIRTCLLLDRHVPLLPNTLLLSAVRPADV